MVNIHRLLSVVVGLAVAGCATTEQASNITLKQALVDTVEAAYAANQRSAELAKELNKPQGLGVRLCVIDASFKINAKHTLDNEITLSAGPGFTSTPISLEGSSSSTAENARENVVKVLYQREDCFPAAKPT